MSQVIYIDVLIFLNIIITFLLLMAVSGLVRCYPTAGRFVISCVLGGISSLVILAPELNFFISLVIKILFSLVIVVTAYNPKSLRKITKLTAYFFVVNFIFAGIMLFASSLPGISLVNYNNGAVYINLSFFSLVASCVVCYFVTWILGKITKHRETHGLVYSAEIFSQGKKIRCSALLDTGNSLTDPFTGESVVIADKETVSAILPESIIRYLLTGESEKGIKLIPCNTVSGRSLLACFRADNIRIADDKGVYVVENIEIAVSNARLDNLILPVDMFDKNERRKADVSV